MTAKTRVQVVPEPQGLTSHKLWMQTRLVDIRQAEQRFRDAGKAIPEAWVDEALMLSVEIGQE